MKKIILASNSPRRKEILTEMGIPFEVYSADVEEVYPDGLNYPEVPAYLSGLKLNAVREKFNDSWILAADTMIFLNGKLLGKPADYAEAEKYLNKLNGTTHQVITGLSVYNGKSVISRSFVTDVTFKKMTGSEIKWYLSTGEWQGVAGGYRIQGKASVFIEKICGTHSNVVGLPISGVYDMLTEQGYSLLN